MPQSKYTNSGMMLTGKPRIDELMAEGLSLEEAIRQYEAESQEAGAVEIDSAAYEELDAQYPKTGWRSGELRGPNTADRPADPQPRDPFGRDPYAPKERGGRFKESKIPTFVPVTSERLLELKAQDELVEADSDDEVGGETVPIGEPIKDPTQKNTDLLSLFSQIGTDPQFSRKGRQLPDPPGQAGSNTALRILEVLGGIGGSLAESRAMGKATKATQAAQARANLINTLRGRAVSGVQPTEPKRGILGTLSRGLGAGAKAFREGREDKATQEQKAFENLVGLTQEERKERELEIDRHKAITTRRKFEHAGGSVEIPDKIENVLRPLGERLADDPYESWSKIQDHARNELMSIYPDLNQEQVKAYLGSIQSSWAAKAKQQKKELNEVVSGIQGLGTQYQPERLVEMLNEELARLDIYVPEKQSKRMVDTLFATAEDYKLGEADRRRYAGLVTIRSGIRTIWNKIDDPDFEDNMGFLISHANAFKEHFTSGRLLSPEVKGALTSIGFTSELLLRTFTGAAAPETEYERFGRMFIGRLTQGEDNFKAQLRALDDGLYENQTGILSAQKVGAPERGDFESDGESEPPQESNLEYYEALEIILTENNLPDTPEGIAEAKRIYGDRQ
jgi:hypothetical protein